MPVWKCDEEVWEAVVACLCECGHESLVELIEPVNVKFKTTDLKINDKIKVKDLKPVIKHKLKSF